METFNKQSARPCYLCAAVAIKSLCLIFLFQFSSYCFAEKHIAYKVKSGDSMLKILKKYDIAQSDTNALIELQKNSPFSYQLKPGDTVSINFDDSSVKQVVIKQQSSTVTLDRTTSGSDYTEVISAHPITRQFVHFTIDKSFSGFKLILG